MARTLKNLLLALLNATLILVALCLFLGWKLASTVEDVTTVFAEKVQIVAPLRTEIQGVRGELTALRSDLAALQVSDITENSAAAQRISDTLTKLDALEQQMQTSQQRVAELMETPGLLFNTAIENSADVVVDRITAVRGCVPAS